MHENLNWPNFFIVGAPKCGTTSLYFHLNRHPQVFLPELKEPHFFASCPVPDQVVYEHCIGDQEAYQRLYVGSRGFPAVGDASPSYLSDERAPERIHEVSPTAKIIIILRDPIDRAYSQYMMNRVTGSDDLPFLKSICQHAEREQQGWWSPRSYVELGMYDRQVRRYFDVFGRQNVLVLLFDDLKRRPHELFSQVAAHIGIDPSLFGDLDLSEPQNSYRSPRFKTAYRILSNDKFRKWRQKLLPESLQAWLHHGGLLYQTKKPAIDEESRRFLQATFEPAIANLEALMARPLPELRKSWVI